MFQCSFVRNAARLAFLICCLSAIWQPADAYAQGQEDVGALKQKVGELIRKQQYTEALPLLERLVAAEPGDPETHFYLGFALIAKANTTKDDAQRKALRVRARTAYLKSKELGIKEPVVDALIHSIPPDGSDGKPFSQNADANRFMVEAESFFSAACGTTSFFRFSRML